MKALLSLCLALAAFFLSACDRTKTQGSSEKPRVHDRIVTMAPSSGEVVFALGLGDQVVGVSRFATFPPEVQEKAKIGGYLDVDLEALLRLQPDVVVLLKEQAELAERLEKLGMDTVLVDHMSVQGIKDSISTLGSYFNKEPEAAELLSDIEARVAEVQAKRAQGETMLLSIGREMGAGKVTGLVAAGAAGVHQELLELAGYQNAYRGRENFPQLTREHLIRMNPRFIVDMVNAKDAERIGLEKIRGDWLIHQELDAVQEGRVFVLAGDQHFVPGPRFCETLEWLAALKEGGYQGE